MAKDGSVGGSTTLAPPADVVERTDRLFRPPSLSLPNDLLGRVAFAIGSTLDLQGVLGNLCGLALEVSGAERVALLLLEGDRLVPVEALGQEPNDKEFAVYRSMPAIVLDDSQRQALAAGRALAIRRAAVDGIVPEEWTATFSLESLVIVPLMAEGQPCGVMVADWPEGCALLEVQRRTLEALGTYAGVAIRNARLYALARRRAEVQEALARAAADLCRPLSPDRVARRLARAYAGVVGARAAGVALLDAEQRRITTIASVGTRKLRAPLSLDALPVSVVSRLDRVWTRAHRPVELVGEKELAVLAGLDPRTNFLALPLIVDGHTRGLGLLAFGPDDPPLDPDGRAAAEALTDVAAAAVERAVLTGRLAQQVSRLDALHRVADALTEGADTSRLLDELNVLLSEHRIKAVGLTFRDRRLARFLGGDGPTAAERVAWSSGDGWTSLFGGAVSVPLRLGRRLVGGLRVLGDGPLGAEEKSLLESVGRQLAEVANRSALRASMTQAERDQAVAGERERIAADLHDSVGQLLVALGLMARRQAEELNGSATAERFARLAELAEKGKWEIDQALRALAFLPASRKGLVTSLRGLARSLESDSGIQVVLVVEGSPKRLEPAIERALYRVAQQAMANAWRHARCQLVRATISFGGGQTCLEIADDGVGLSQRDLRGGVHVGITVMRRTIEDVGGSLKVRNGHPRGVIVEARVPQEAR